MFGHPSTAALSAATVLALALMGAAQEVPAGKEPRGARPAPQIEAKAEQYLKAMSSCLTGLKTFAFQAEEFFDDVLDDGQKLQYANQRKIVVRRPGHVFAESLGDTANSRFYFDGKTVTVFDRKNKTYATEAISAGTVEAMLDELHARYGIDPPLADFLTAEPYKGLTKYVQTGAYAGLHHVGKTKCHHLAFRQRRLDWQIWIDAGEKPLPRKLVITFKRQIGEPQYVAIMHRWDTNPKVGDETFAFAPPEGVRKVDFLKRHGEPGSTKKTPRK